MHKHELLATISAFETWINSINNEIDLLRKKVQFDKMVFHNEVNIEKEKELVEKSNSLEELVIPDSFDYSKINSLSAEAKQKFIKIKPRTLGQAGRISGVNPTDVQILMVYMGR